MSNLLFEDMIRVETEHYVCRIWRQQYDVDDMRTPINSIKRLAHQLLERPYADLAYTAQTLVSIEAANSVEIVDRATGCGVCVHKDWP